MRCERAERELSERLDEVAASPLDPDVRDHVATCPACRSFEAGARRVRTLVRVDVAPPVPDLVDRIMSAVDEVAWSRPRGPRAWRREVAAFVAAAVAGSVVVGGLPGLAPGPDVVRAADVPRRVAAAATEVTSYRAAFRITERNYAPDVPVRRFRAEVAFRAPEAFRAEIRDDTAYPSSAWPRNDIVLTVDRARWSVAGPGVCPREALPACHPGDRDRRAVRGRAPFDGHAPVPTDVVLPIKTLSGSGRLAVVGTGTALGRPAVTVAIAVRDAAPLFAYLHAAGSWRPLFPLDAVEVTLDRETWFPLRYRVRAAAVADREAWAVRHGLPPERPGATVFDARATGFRTSLPPGWRPGAAVGGPGRDHGFRDLPPARLPAAVGFVPAAPGDLRGLRPHRSGVAGTRREAVTSYARGLRWLTVRETRSWTGPSLFGDVGTVPAEVRLPGGGVAYVEPSTATLGTRVALHGDDRDLFLESNLSMPELLRVAASLPVTGRPLPGSWRTRPGEGVSVRAAVPLERALRDAPFVLLPRRLPPEYRLWTIRIATVAGGTHVTAWFQRPGGESDGVGIVLHQGPGDALAPPLEPDVVAVKLRGVTGRYSPARGELEWLEGGIYRSVRAEGLGLAWLVVIADSLAAPTNA